MSTVQPIFKIQRKRAIEDHKRMLALGLELPSVVADLMSKDQFDRLAKTERKNEVITGGLGLLLALIAFTVDPRMGYAVLVLIPIAGWRFFKAQQKLSESNARWKLYNEKMQTLEGDQGFLWRFEHLMEDWGLDLEKSDRETLAPICLASKNLSLADEGKLSNYWKWILLLEGRLRVLLQETDAADPLDIVDEIIVVVSQKYKEQN